MRKKPKTDYEIIARVDGKVVFRIKGTTKKTGPARKTRTSSKRLSTK